MYTQSLVFFFLPQMVLILRLLFVQTCFSSIETGCAIGTESKDERGRRRIGFGVDGKGSRGLGWGGVWALKSSPSSFYLEIIELDCDEVVAALSWEKPLWLDSRLVIEPLKWERENQRTCERTETLHFFPANFTCRQHLSNLSLAVTNWMHSVCTTRAQDADSDPCSQIKYTGGRFTLCGTQRSDSDIGCNNQ